MEALAMALRLHLLCATPLSLTLVSKLKFDAGVPAFDAEVALLLLKLLFIKISSARSNRPIAQAAGPIFRKAQ